MIILDTYLLSLLTNPLKLAVPLPANKRMQKRGSTLPMFGANLNTQISINISCIIFQHTGCPVTSWGFLRLPSDSNYKPSPDGFAGAFLVKVKTSAENAEMPFLDT